jgi:hypothetical protein
VDAAGVVAAAAVTHLAKARAEKLDQIDRLHEWMDARARP